MRAIDRAFATAVVALLVGTSFPCLGQEAAAGSSIDVRLSMNAVQATAVALRRFKKDQPRVDPKNFYVVVTERSDIFEVDFVPNQAPIREGQHGDTAFVEVPSGSGNAFGRNIRYEVSKQGLRIVRTVLPR
jgi:hypothetical protein